MSIEMMSFHLFRGLERFCGLFPAGCPCRFVDPRRHQSFFLDSWRARILSATHRSRSRFASSMLRNLCSPRGAKEGVNLFANAQSLRIRRGRDGSSGATQRARRASSMFLKRSTGTSLLLYPEFLLEGGGIRPIDGSQRPLFHLVESEGVATLTFLPSTEIFITSISSN